METEQGVEKERLICVEIAELLIEKGYTSYGFSDVLIRAIREEMEYIEIQHSD